VTSTPKTLFASSLIISGAGRLDLGNNALLLDNTVTPIATVRQYLQQGYQLNGAAGYGDWKGATGIITSAAWSNPKLSIGYIDGATANDPNFGPTVPGWAANPFLRRTTLIGARSL